SYATPRWTSHSDGRSSDRAYLGVAGATCTRPSQLAASQLQSRYDVFLVARSASAGTGSRLRRNLARDRSDGLRPEIAVLRDLDPHALEESRVVIVRAHSNRRMSGTTQSARRRRRPS